MIESYIYNMFRASYPEPSDEERELYTALLQEWLMEKTDQTLHALGVSSPSAELYRIAFFAGGRLNGVNVRAELRNRYRENDPRLFQGMPPQALEEVFYQNVEEVLSAANASSRDPSAPFFDLRNIVISALRFFDGKTRAYNVEAEGPTGTPATSPTIASILAKVTDGKQSGLTISRDAPEVFPLGRTVVTLTVKNPNGKDLPVPFDVIVEDTTPPDLTLPDDIHIQPVGTDGTPFNDEQLTAFYGKVGAVDVVDPEPVITAAVPEVYDFGVTKITFGARDAAGNATQDTVKVTVAPTYYVVYGTNSVLIKEKVTINSGFVGAPEEATERPLGGKAEVTIREGTVLKPGTQVYANSLEVKKNVHISLAFYNDLTGTGNIEAFRSPMPSLEVSPIPPFPDFDAGTEHITVNAPKGDPHESTLLDSGSILAPGSYGDLKIQGTAEKPVVLHLAGGEYNFNSICLGQSVELRIDAPCEIRVLEDLETKPHTYIGPDGSNVSAQDIVFYVAGIGKPGKPSGKQVVFRLGVDNIFHGSVFVPDGTIRIGQKSIVTGAFIARNVEVRDQATLVFDSAFV